MAICPHCQTRTERSLTACPTGDGYYTIDEEEWAENRDNEHLGQLVGGRFVVRGLLGSGSMAHVYRALQVEVDRDVALKMFRAEDLVRPDDARRDEALAKARRRFAQEARVLGKLAHPNCVTLYDFGSQGDFLYIAMEFVSGLSLRQAMVRGLRLDAIVEVVRQMLLALREAHDLDVVHRDLKPENVILSFKYADDEPVVKVVDFGIAKLVGHDNSEGAVTSFGALFGTPAYMSPEQCRGAVDEIGPHSDIYALGCLLYEMLCGRLPYESQVPVHMLRMHMESPLPAITPRRGIDVSPELARFVTKCLQKEGTSRFANAREALLEFDRVTSDAALPRLTSPGRGRVSVPRNRIAGVELAPPVPERPSPALTVPPATAPARPDSPRANADTKVLDVHATMGAPRKVTSAGLSRLTIFVAILAIVALLVALSLLAALLTGAL